MHLRTRSAFRSLCAAVVASAALLQPGAVRVAAATSSPVPIVRTVPAYPPAARRFDLEGAVTVSFYIGEDGRVERAQILDSTADVFDDAVLRALGTWRYATPVPPGPYRLRFPFRLEDEGATSPKKISDTTPRAIASVPKHVRELGIEAVTGWATLRVALDPTGKLVGLLLLKDSAPEFDATVLALSKAIKFAAAVKPDQPDLETINTLRIEVDAKGALKVQQVAAR